MENIDMAKKTEEIAAVRPGPKNKDPQDKVAPITFYSTPREIKNFGGLEAAKKFCIAAYQKELARRKK